ncbi:MAG: 6-carboxytetrahydropterin synthase QueD [Candidatus Bathyarchaeota archaeon]|nr:6-carboxytetrahydropterin synthase QueD [Candidatus Bathyarchaeota archaeon]
MRGKKMYRLRIETEFDAAHNLKGYEGKCANLHGHTWKVETFIVGKELDSIGMIMDFGLLKKRLTEITETLDHSYLNDKAEIGNPTSENIAKYIFDQMKLPDGVKLEKVRIWESPRSWCEYYE